MRGLKRLMSLLVKGVDKKKVRRLCERLLSASSLDEEIEVLRSEGFRVLTDPRVLTLLRRKASGRECRLAPRVLCLFDGLGKRDVEAVVSLIYNSVDVGDYVDTMASMIEEASILIELAEKCRGAARDAGRVRGVGS